MNPPAFEITAKIREILASKILDCPVDQVTDSAVANLDSIGRITLLVELENDFNVELTAEEYDVQIFSSIERLSEFVVSHQEKQKGSI